MLQSGNSPEPGAPFFLLAKVNTVAGIPQEVSSLNIPGNVARGLPRLHEMAGWKEDKGDAPIALVGGGPSLRDTYRELADFPVKICAGSSHDWLVQNSIVPEFCVIADPDAVAANYVRNPQRDTTYLLATQCHPEVYEALDGYSVRTWHLYPCDHDLLGRIDPNWEAVGGGCTVGLRCVSIALMMGYRNHHYFGFDSCYAEDRSHAYDFSEPGEEAFLGADYHVSVNWGENGPNPEAKVYRCSGYMMAQAQHFKDLFLHYGPLIQPTFHGPGLMADWTAHYLAKLNEATNGICGG